MSSNGKLIPGAAFSNGKERRKDGETDIESENEDDEEILDENEDDEKDMMAILPDRVRHRVEKLKELNDEKNSIMKKYLVERAALEHKYRLLCEPLYDQRVEILKGNMDEAIEADATISSSSPQSNNDEEDIIGIPQFWVCAMGHLETVAELVTEQDVDCLESLINITCDDFPNGQGFTLSFFFEPNEYFGKSVLTKTYEIPNLLLEDEPVLKNVSGCPIDWKPNKSLTHKPVQKKQRSKKNGQIRTVTRSERCDSFFHFFNPPKMPSLEEMDEEEADAVEEAFDHDYDVAQAFRNHLIPKAVLWFTGEALDDEFQEAMDAIANSPTHSLN